MKANLSSIKNIVRDSIFSKGVLLLLIITLSVLISSCGTSGDTEDATTQDNGQDALSEPASDTPLDQTAQDASIQGSLASDLGFRPDVNGFNFPNYGGDPAIQNLTPAELRRMFGDGVCASLNGEDCTLTPPAAQWMEEVNGNMAGGHCEGMAALSLLMYSGQVPADTFGSVNSASDLSLQEPSLQHEIAYWWATQLVSPTSSEVIKGTPTEILNVLQQMTPDGETYTIGIYKRDRSGGHAITPFAVEDLGDGTFSVLVYDNNYPSETRQLLIDTNQDTWAYEASINPDVAPDLYEGDASTQTLDLTPTSSRLTQQYCPFCENQASSKAGNSLAETVQPYNEIYLDGDGHLLITDDQGNQLGFADGALVNTIPGANYTEMKLGLETDYPEPIYRLPISTNFTAVIDGSTLTSESETDLVMIGKGYSYGVEGIALEPNQKDTVVFQPSDGLISYDTEGSESPNIVLGIEDTNEDYYFEVQGADMQGGGTLTVSLDQVNKNLLINTEKLQNEGSFNLVLTRITDDGEDTFYADDISLKAGALVYIEYGNWKGNGQGLYFGVDTNGDGTIDDEYEVVDQELPSN